MPGQLDSIFGPLASTLISAFGKTMVYQRVTKTFIAASGTNSETIVASTVVGKPPSPYNERRVDGTVVQYGDLRTMLATESIDFVPTIGDTMLIDAATWQVVGVRPIYSGQLAAAYEIQLRQ